MNLIEELNYMKELVVRQHDDIQLKSYEAHVKYNMRFHPDEYPGSFEENLLNHINKIYGFRVTMAVMNVTPVEEREL